MRHARRSCSARRVEAQGADHLPGEACGDRRRPYGGGVTNRHGARPQLCSGTV